MIQLLKSNNFSTIILFIVVFFCVKLPFLFFYEPNTLPYTFVFDGLPTFQFNSNILNFVAAQLSILAQCFLINYYFQKSDLYSVQYIVPAYIFMLISSIIPNYNFFNYFHIITFIILFIFNLYISIYQETSVKAEAFNIGVLFGIATFIFPNIIVGLPFILIMFYIPKAFNFKEMLLILVGIAMVWFYIFSVAYFLNISIHNPFDFYFYQETYIHRNNIIELIPTILSVLYLLFSFVSLRGIAQATSVKRKKSVNLIVFLLLGMSVTVLLSSRYLFDVLSILFIPLSIYISLLLLRIKKTRLSEALNLIFLLTIFIVHVKRMID